MFFWQDITVYLIVGAAAVYCCAQLLMLGRKWSAGGSGCSKGCNTCPANRAESVSGEGVQQAALVQISGPAKR